MVALSTQSILRVGVDIGGAADHVAERLGGGLQPAAKKPRHLRPPEGDCAGRRLLGRRGPAHRKAIRTVSRIGAPRTNRKNAVAAASSRCWKISSPATTAFARQRSDREPCERASRDPGVSRRVPLEEDRRHDGERNPREHLVRDGKEGPRDVAAIRITMIASVLTTAENSPIGPSSWRAICPSVPAPGGGARYGHVLHATAEHLADQDPGRAAGGSRTSRRGSRRSVGPRR
jgi:hypothetical protein